MSFISPVLAAGKQIGNIEGWLPKSYFPNIGATGVDAVASGGLVQIISVAVGLLTVIGGLMFLVYFFMGGIGWLTSSGNPENLDRAKKKLTNAAIGVIIVVAAFGLAYILGSMLGIQILNPASYLPGLAPILIATGDFGHKDYGIFSLAAKLMPAFTGDTALSASEKLNLVFSIFVGGITLFGGLFFILYVVMGGLSWVTAGGNPEALEKAKKQIYSAFIGLVVIVAAYTVTYILGSVLGLNILQPGETIRERLKSPNEGVKCILPTPGVACTLNGPPCCAPLTCVYAPPNFTSGTCQ